MEILSRKLVLTMLVASVMFVGSQTLAGPGKSKGKGGWEPNADHVESVVISIQANPVAGAGTEGLEAIEEADPLAESAEPACVAIQIGMNLLMDTVEVDEVSVAVTPVDEIYLFPTLGGIELVNPENGIPGQKDGALNRMVCLTPNGMRSLNQLLQGFVSLGGQVVSCPLCAQTRLFEDPNFGVVGNAEEIHNLFLYADKVIDF